jgi:para-aminobenzoate synthetase component 1
MALSAKETAPLVEEIEGLSPLDAFEAFRRQPFSFFLDSGMDAAGLGRYSFMGAEPFLVFRSRGADITLRHRRGVTHLTGDPLAVLKELLTKYRLSLSDAPVPFTGGAVGYFSYDLGRMLEKLPHTAADDLKLPDVCLGFYNRLLAFDNLTGKAYLIATGLPQHGRGGLEQAHRQMDELKARLKNLPQFRESSAAPSVPQITSNFSRQEYMEAVEKARRYIIAGDIFEVNLSQRFEAEIDITPYELYLRLRRRNPAPFACYMDFGDVQIAGASPERFIKLRGNLAQTRPIKGTRPRGKTPQEDHALADGLAASAKDHAENVMIVDLERNDLGRVCEYGSVKVTELAKRETYATVFHLTSTVEGKLRPGSGITGLLRAAFPGGSITGAPKVRAMEIIEELEPTRRGIYTGSLGYLGFNGDADLNIAIRTFIVKGKKACFQAGGAVVYDSNPEHEYQETLDKARALMDALKGGES